MFGNNKIEKTIWIEGMSCMHCVKKVENALKDLKNVKAVDIDLEQKKAVVTMKDEISNEELKRCIEDIGYDVIKIEK